MKPDSRSVDSASWDEHLHFLQSQDEFLFSIAERLRNNPETGFFEFGTAEILKEALADCGARIRDGIARTGIRAEIGPSNAPSIALIADMDALPTANAPSGIMHSCGHHAQMAVMLAVFRALCFSGLAGTEHVRFVFIAAPAEEYVEIDKRLKLKEEGQIVYLSGKQEMIRLGIFDDIDVALKYHSMEESPRFDATVNGTLNGFMAKRITFVGKAAHAGAHPEDGINALNAASIALQAIHAQRETFPEAEHIRVHPIIREGGTVINSVPERVVLETYIRGARHEAVLDAEAKVDRALAAGALAVGASLIIANTPGYQAFAPDPMMGEVLAAAAETVAAASRINFEDHSFASDDIGDIASLVPTCQLGFSGFCGTIHSSSFLPADPKKAYRDPAEILFKAALLLAYNKGRKTNEIRQAFQPRFTKTAYLEALAAMFSRKAFNGARAQFDMIQ